MIKELLEEILNEYPVARERQRFTGNPLGQAVKSDLRNEFLRAKDENGKPLIDSDKYKLQGSIGAGNWAMIPWFAIFDKTETTTAQKGVYLVYLFAADGSRVYLSLMQSYTELKTEYHGNQAITDVIEKLRSDTPQSFKARGYIRGDLDLGGPNIGELGRNYQRVNILAKVYEKGRIPDDGTLIADLKDMLGKYQEYHKQGGRKGSTNETEENKMIKEIKEYISSKGFSYPDGLVENYFLSLKSKPFVILAGTSGTGKTRLVKLFAEAIGSNEANGMYKLVPVRPDWSDSTDLLGHLDLNGKFHPGEITDFIRKANDDKDPTHHYFLCLDEMNLARVEYYLSDILSVMETRDRNASGEIVTSRLLSDSAFGSDEESKEKYGNLILSDNLYIVGTVNMDETTFPFSKKVLDRANTIEFSYVDLNPSWKEGAPGETATVQSIGKEIAPEHLFLSELGSNQSFIDSICQKLTEINETLLPAGLQVGYRVRDEVCFYMESNKELKLLDENDAFDNEIMQKILPRIQGNSELVKEALCGMFKICAGDYTQINTKTEISKQMNTWLSANEARYPKSAGKIAFMMERLENDGFTSYWL